MYRESIIGGLAFRKPPQFFASNRNPPHFFVKNRHIRKTTIRFWTFKNLPLKRPNVNNYLNGAYGWYELHFKAKAREQTNNFFNTLKLYSAQKIGLNRKPWAKKKTLFLRHCTMKS